jgi:alpha-N-arabinofuranosidase
VDGEGKFAPHLIEEEYDLEDALVAAGFLNSFIRHADVVKIANLAQIVNVIAPILTRGDKLLLQSIYFPIMLYAQRREGIALQTVVRGPGYESKNYGFVHTIDASAILGKEVLHAFLVNRNTSEPAIVELAPAGIRLKSVLSADLVTGPSASACNTFEQPDSIQNRTLEKINLTDQKATFQLPPLSVAAISFGMDDKS